MTSITYIDLLSVTESRYADLGRAKARLYEHRFKSGRTEDGRFNMARYSVLQFDRYDGKTGIVYFCSPYINKLNAMGLSLQKNDD